MESAASIVMNVAQAQCGIAEEYDKRPDVFALLGADGSQCLIQALSDEDMQRWIGAINRAAAAAPAHNDGSKPGKRRFTLTLKR